MERFEAGFYQKTTLHSHWPTVDWLFGNSLEQIIFEANSLGYGENVPIFLSVIYRQPTLAPIATASILFLSRILCMLPKQTRRRPDNRKISKKKTTGSR
ncbi:unnamed protein product [Protopolystoma xenopodis]|uniref:Uncharacterized protein n=1 Tax=Protopolystoma xenopodis TaxID=117903 RepID=A0A448XM72_9PLAT|nr:unnamed protein product [Protopolystoma xenopodis]